MAPFRAERPLLLALLLTATSGLACQGDVDRSSIVVNVVPGPGMTVAPQALRVFVRAGELFVFEDERLPVAGMLTPRPQYDYGDVVLHLGDLEGEVEVDLFAIHDGGRSGRGRASVWVPRGRQSRMVVTILPTESWPELDDLLGLGPNGQACIDDSQCLSGACVDEVCCESTACGPCEACNLAGHAGQCASVPLGEPDGPDCDQGRVCDGQGSCRTEQGGGCGVSADCASGHCVDGICCSSACEDACTSCAEPGRKGQCVPVAAGMMDDACAADQRCDGKGACGPACLINEDCPPGQHCKEGTCAAVQADGGSCRGDDECSSGLCSDGFCCRQACGPCLACTGPGGSCEPMPAGQPDQRPGSACKGVRACTGDGRCALAIGAACQSDDMCSSGSCASGACCESACFGLCRTCADGACRAIVNAVDPGRCDGNYRCDTNGLCRRAEGYVCRYDKDCATGWCQQGRCGRRG